MRFLTLSPYSRGHGAYERHRRMARALIAAGHEVVWMAPGLDFPAGETFVPVPPSHRWLRGPLRWVARVWSMLNARPDLLRGVDAIFTVSEYDAFALLTHREAARIPHLFFQRGDTIACEQYHAANAVRLDRRLKSRLLLTWYPRMQDLVMRKVTGVVVQAPFLGDDLRRRLGKLTCPVITLPNDSVFEWSPEPADPALTARLDRHRPKNGLLIGMVAQAFWQGKGFDLFLDVMAKLKHEPSLRAVIIGYGEDEGLIQPAIERLGLSEQVLFLGRVGAARALMPQLDLVVVPTRFPDACPNVVLEAMEAGNMILASDIPAHQWQLADPELMFPNGDADALAARILALSDPERRRSNRAAVAGRRDFFQFDWDARVATLLESHAKGTLSAHADPLFWTQAAEARPI